ncbi:hypothetical protein BURMUCGD1_3585 [Burkholderia multivorans CGD1]|nr:hypothetical protein BURMUCGD1_3585 [Burkholderia multivorans CGD1]
MVVHGALFQCGVAVSFDAARRTVVRVPASKKNAKIST